MAMPHPDRQSIGLAGEFFVAAELQRRGVHASLTLGRSTDIVASNPQLGRTVVVEVRTTTEDSWIVGEILDRPEFLDENRFLALVKLPQSVAPPTIYLFGSWEFSDLFGTPSKSGEKPAKVKTLSVRKVAGLLPEGGGWEKVLFRLGQSNVKPKFGSAKGQVKMTADFDETPADFADYQ